MERKHYLKPAEYTTSQIIEITLEQFSLANRGLSGMKRRLIEIRDEAARTGSESNLALSINRLILEIEAEQKLTNSKIAKYEDYRKNGGQ